MERIDWDELWRSWTMEQKFHVTELGLKLVALIILKGALEDTIIPADDEFLAGIAYLERDGETPLGKRITNDP